MKLDPKKSTYDQGTDFHWVGHKDANYAEGDGSDYLLQCRRYDIEIYGGVVDAEACYSYDDFALCELNGTFYMVQTSGCSCPSPTETWGVVAEGTISDIFKWAVDPLHSTYEIPRKQLAEFLALINEVALLKGGKCA